MNERTADNHVAGSRLEQTYKSEKPRLLARVRAAGRSDRKRRRHLRHYMHEEQAAMKEEPASE